MIVTVPATSANLGPGFDTLGLALALRNKVEFYPSKVFSVSIKGEGAANPRLKGNNLFVSIFNDHYKKLTDDPGIFRFEFKNQIPLSRGLGSSSAVIVSAISAAYSAAGAKVHKRKLLNLALQYEPHPDNITPAVMGGFNATAVDNGKVFSQKKRIPKYLKAVVVIPNKPISTARSRSVMPHKYKREDAVFNIAHASLLTAAFFNESWEMLRVAAKDRFHQVMRMKFLPELFEVQKIAIEHRALMSTLSGSGSTFFNMVYSDDAERLAGSFKEKFPEFRVVVLDFDNDGVLFLK